MELVWGDYSGSVNFNGTRTFLLVSYCSAFAWIMRQIPSLQMCMPQTFNFLGQGNLCNINMTLDILKGCLILPMALSHIQTMSPSKSLGPKVVTFKRSSKVYFNECIYCR